ncbi:MAG: SMC-Scp complex subunit ScpB [Candidatus Jacksonbacteria bacterium]|nr:SMC-Scp complex subunit ScpB [Candidatus Jacksonbacteria bacterium]
MNHSSVIESLLFVSGKPLQYKKLAAFLDISEKQVKEAIANLKAQYKNNTHGLQITTTEKQVQLGSLKDNAQQVQAFLDLEIQGKLTQPALEALTVIAYRGPVTRQELESIRGVNCSLILRNLLIRGFIKEVKDKTLGLPVYSVTIEFLTYLGISKTSELPDYTTLSAHPDLEEFLTRQE